MTALTARRPAGYQPRHRRGRKTSTGRWIVADPVGPDYNPLSPAVRLRLAPHAWGREDVALHAGELDQTGRIDPAAVIAWADLGDPAADVARIWRQTTGQEPPAVADDDTQQIGTVQ